MIARRPGAYDAGGVMLCTPSYILLQGGRGIRRDETNMLEERCFWDGDQGAV